MWSNQYAPKSETEQIDWNDSKLVMKRFSFGHHLKFLYQGLEFDILHDFRTPVKEKSSDYFKDLHKPKRWH